MIISSSGTVIEMYHIKNDGTLSLSYPQVPSEKMIHKTKWTGDEKLTISYCIEIGNKIYATPTDILVIK